MSATKLRSFRINDQLWEAALAIAKERKETVTAVLERALRRYVAAHERAQRQQPAD